MIGESEIIVALFSAKSRVKCRDKANADIEIAAGEA